VRHNRRVICWRALCVLGLPAIGLFAVLIASRTAPAADSPAAIEVQESLQIPLEQRRRIVRGEAVSFPVAENSEREIAAGVALTLPAPFSQLAEYLSSGQLIAQDATIGDFGLVPPEAPSPLVGPPFSSSERDEAAGLLDATPGTRFNLSTGEIESLRSARSAEAGSSRDTLDLASGSFRRLLSERVLSYRQSGLAAIAPYARTGGAVTDPAVELRLAIADAQRIGRSGTELHQALLHYPADQPAQVASYVYWVKRRVQRRPHLSLLHRMVVTGAGSTVHLERYFYVEHSFNSMVILTGAFPFQEGTLLVASTRVSTDEILGVGSQLKRTVARGQMRDEMRTRLERVRSSLSRSQPGGAESQSP
jgi:hypothetical protein